MKERLMMRTYYNDIEQRAEPPAGEPKADSWSTPDGADGTDGTDVSFHSSGPVKDGRPSQATQIVDLVLERGAELFHDLNDESYVTIAVNGHRQTLPVERMGKLAGKLFYDAFRKAPGNQAVHEALDLLSGKAFYEGAAHPVWTRLADHDGKLYLDLGDDTWQAVEIDFAGWRLIPSGQVPVKFRRPKGMLSLPVPKEGGSLDGLDRFLNVADVQNRMLVKGWLTGVYCLSGGRPILELSGEQGSSKSTLARMLRRLLDPCSAPLRAAPHNKPRHEVVALPHFW